MKILHYFNALIIRILYVKHTVNISATVQIKMSFLKYMYCIKSIIKSKWVNLVMKHNRGFKDGEYYIQCNCDLLSF